MSDESLERERSERADRLITSAFEEFSKIPLASIYKRATGTGFQQHVTQIKFERGAVSLLRSFGANFASSLNFEIPTEADMQRHLDSVDKVRRSMVENGLTLDAVEPVKFAGAPERMPVLHFGYSPSLD